MYFHSLNDLDKADGTVLLQQPSCKPPTVLGPSPF
jgi:hypothetical protein